MYTAYGTLYAKDSSGNLVRILPRGPYYEYTGASSNHNGVTGLVPAATSAEKDYFLRGDGTWGKQDNADTIDVDIHTDEEVIPRVDGPYTSDYTYGNPVTLKANVKIDDAYVIGGESLLPTVENQVDELEGFEVDCSSATNNSEVAIELDFMSSTTDDFWDAYTYTGSFSDLVAAGATGVEMTGGGGVENLITDLNAAGKRVYLTSESIGDGYYRLKPIVVTPEERNVDLVADLVVTKESGLETRVDLKPLLGSVGGKVETKLVSQGAFETVTLYDIQTFNPSAPDIVFPAVFSSGSASEAGLYDPTASFPPPEMLPLTLDGDSVVCEVPSSYSWYESPAVLAFFLMAPDANVSSPADLLILSNISGIDTTTQTVIFSFNTVQELFDAGGTLPLNVLTNGGLPEVVDDFPVQYYLHVELCEAQDGACYRFTVLTGAGETKTVLHLEPSCDTDIDLTPVITKGVSGELVCPVPYPLNSMYFSRISCYDANKQYIGVCDLVDRQNNTLSATLLPGTAYLTVSMARSWAGSSIITWNTSLVGATVGSTTCVDGQIGEVH